MDRQGPTQHFWPNGQQPNDRERKYSRSILRQWLSSRSLRTTAQSTSNKKSSVGLQWRSHTRLTPCSTPINTMLDAWRPWCRHHHVQGSSNKKSALVQWPSHTRLMPCSTPIDTMLDAGLDLDIHTRHTVHEQTIHQPLILRQVWTIHLSHSFLPSSKNQPIIQQHTITLIQIQQSTRSLAWWSWFRILTYFQHFWLCPKLFCCYLLLCSKDLLLQNTGKSV